VTPLELLAAVLRFVGLLVVLPGLWSCASGLRTVVSGRVDERRRSAHALKWGLPLMAVGLILLFGGTWLANWIHS